MKDRIIANLPKWAPWAASAPWLLNVRDRVSAAAKLSERALGLSARRTLPKWRRDTFLRASEVQSSNAPVTPAASGSESSVAEVVLFVDTFTNYFEPENARAAARLLRSAGYRVHIARPLTTDGQATRPLCCGRTYLAAGLVDAAKSEARRIISALGGYVERGVPVVGLEPSCLLSLRDEFLAMGFGPAAERLSERAFLIEEFLASERKAGRLSLDLLALPERRALLHGHCHQKAFDALDSARQVLSMIPDLAVEVIDSSCCGMAGSFGYEAAHYDVSMRMAELSLLPAIRTAGTDTLIVADGTSCRHQIRDGTRESGAREALHVVRVLDRAVVKRSDRSRAELA